MYKIIAIIAVSFFIFILWIIYLADTASSSVFIEFVGSIPYGDKIGHFCLFGFLTFTAIAGSKFRAFMWGKVKIYYGMAIVLLFVVTEEISQAFIPSRTFDFVDLAADSVGIQLWP